MISYGTRARSYAPAHARTHVPGAFGTERAERNPIRENSKRRQEVCDKRASLSEQQRREAPATQLQALYTQMLALAAEHEAKALAASDAILRLAHKRAADAIAQAIARAAY